MKIVLSFVVILGFVLLAGCGGGGSDGDSLLTAPGNTEPNPETAEETPSETEQESETETDNSDENTGSENNGGSSGGSQEVSTTDPDNDDSLNNIAAAVRDGPYANIMVDCVLAETYEELCSLDELPLLGMEVATPEVADVMNRVLVSHDWMAERFETLIGEYPIEFLQLFKGLTAIVIDDDIRPAFYSPAIGAIYIDPAYLWVTNAEKKTINTQQDYRSGFDDALAFLAFDRYLTSEGAYPANFGSLTDDNSRLLSDASFYTARLLLHELAHVNDFLPYGSYDQLESHQTVAQAVEAIAAQRVSNQLNAQMPLQSTLWQALGEVMFQGETATFQQRQLSAEDVGEAFENDIAADDYAYSSQYEDLAMLFETAMMKYFWNVDFEQAFMTPQGYNPTYCNDFLVGWGARRWIGETSVKARAQFVTDALLPTLDLSDFYETLEPPMFMVPGDNWCQPLLLNSQLQKPMLPMIVPLDDYRRRH